jgi:hypothetical protein
MKQVAHILLKLVGSVICALGVNWLMWAVWFYLSSLQPQGRHIPIINLRDGFYIITYFVLPLASALAIAGVERLLGAGWKGNRWRFVSAFLGGVAGPILIYIFAVFGLSISSLWPQISYVVIGPCVIAIMAVVGDLLWEKIKGAVE